VHVGGIELLDPQVLQLPDPGGLPAEAGLELVEVAELGVARPHAVQPPCGQGGVQVVEELVVAERVDGGRMPRQVSMVLTWK